MTLSLQAPTSRPRTSTPALLASASPRLSAPGSSLGKRLIDVVGAVVGLIVLAPVLGLVALLVKVTDPAGPVLEAAAVGPPVGADGVQPHRPRRPGT